MTLSPQFKKHLTTGLQIGTATALAAGVGISGATAKGMEGDFESNGLTASDISTIMNKPHNTPTWDRHLSQQFKGFRAMDKRPADHIPSHVVGVHNDATATRMPFDRAVKINSDDERANNIFVVGYK
jgi:hypothetical protein